jgi:hypothetical protein
MAIALVELIEQARRQLGQLTGLPLGSTVSVRKDDGQPSGHGTPAVPGWRLRVEVVEKKSLPDSQDLLATYEVAVDDDGRVLDFSRIAMRRRMDPVAVGTDESAN